MIFHFATQSFLETQTKVFPDKGELHVSRLLFWFLGDFGGYRGIRRILHRQLNLDSSGLSIKFRDYDWSEKLHHFS